MLKKRKLSVYIPSASTMTEESAEQVKKTLLLSCDDDLTIKISPEVCRLLPSTVFVNSLNIVRINTNLLPGHDLALTSRMVFNATLMPSVISNIVATFLSDDKLRINPGKCGDCMFPLHKSWKGLSVNCKSSSSCIVCRFSLISSTSAISTCEVCNGFIAHEHCIDRIETKMCQKCTPLDERVNCVGCTNVVCKTVNGSSECTTCMGHLCRTCQEKSKCNSCFEFTCDGCQTKCMECDEGFCNTCWTLDVFECRLCSGKLLCRKCSASNVSCDVCHHTTSVCVLCSTFNTCGICNQRVCEDCNCRCESGDYDTMDNSDDDY